MAMKAILARRFAPLNFSAIDGYPHLVPQIDEWKDLLPRFYEGDDDNPFEHVHEFHALMQQLDIHHEDILMKMFMYSLEGDARQWYRTLPASSISSLKTFMMFFILIARKFIQLKDFLRIVVRGMHHIFKIQQVIPLVVMMKGIIIERRT
jgi:hypothetical protein